MGEAQDIPIIVISGDNSAKDKQRAMEAGAVDFFTKPIDQVALLAAVNRVLGVEAKTVGANPA
jgi:CheY-like chemotaxis protein